MDEEAEVRGAEDPGCQWFLAEQEDPTGVLSLIGGGSRPACCPRATGEGTELSYVTHRNTTRPISLIGTKVCLLAPGPACSRRPCDPRVRP